MTVARPEVSVIVPVYQVAAHVDACLGSVITQTVPPAEVILVDDRGTDDSVERAEKLLSGSDLTWRTVRHPENRGLGAARNTGLAAATGERVCFLDSDDRLDPRFLESMTAAMDLTGADLVACRTGRARPGGPILTVDEPVDGRTLVSGREFARGLLHNRFRAYAGSKLFRRGVLAAEPFDVGRAYEDFRPLLRTALAVPTVALVDEPLYRYTVNPDSISARFAPHTTDLFAVGDDVRAELAAAGLLDAWRHDLAVYETVNVVMPVANLAIRAHAGGHGGPHTAAAIRAARRRLTAGTLRSLAVRRRWRRLAAMTTLKLSPTLYRRRLVAAPP